MSCSATVFIFGNFGAPRMGVAGAGLAGALSTYIGLFIMIAYALSPAYRHFHWFDVRRISQRTIFDLLRISVPSAVATIAVMTGFMLFVWIVAKLDARRGRQHARGGSGGRSGQRRCHGRHRGRAEVDHHGVPRVWYVDGHLGESITRRA